MTTPADGLTPVSPDDLAAALAFALRYSGRKRVHNADEIMAEIVAKRLVPPSALAIHDQKQWVSTPPRTASWHSDKPLSWP